MGLSEDTIRQLVRDKYAKIAQGAGSNTSETCCGGTPALVDIGDLNSRLDYTDDQLATGLAEASLGLGCGNPVTMADLQPGETVLDLGSGPGFDAFLAAECVGSQGRVIGVDMTQEMIARAQTNAERLNIDTVEFKLGEIEHLPVPDGSVDVVLSNCVINLAPDKSAVYREIHRVLKPGGRICVSDVLRSGAIPEHVKNDPSAFTG